MQTKSNIQQINFGNLAKHTYFVKFDVIKLDNKWAAWKTFNIWCLPKMTKFLEIYNLVERNIKVKVEKSTGFCNYENNTILNISQQVSHAELIFVNYDCPQLLFKVFLAEGKKLAKSVCSKGWIQLRAP